MKKYDFIKAKKLITESADCLESASLGMHEDWFWTSRDVWEDGKFTRELPDNADEIYDAYVGKKKAGVSMFDESMKEFDSIMIMGIYSSDWATPTLQLKYKDGDEKMIPCYTMEGEEMPLGEKMQRQLDWTSGVLSSQVQENITPLEAEQRTER